MTNTAFNQTTPELKNIPSANTINKIPKDVAFVVACIRENKLSNLIRPIAETRINKAPEKRSIAVIIVVIFFVLSSLKQQLYL